jgi:hypothetical protein
MNTIPIRLPGNAGVDDFLRRGGEVWSVQRKRVLDIEEDYQRRRTALTSEYARKLSDVAAEGSEALAALEAEHRGLITEEKAKLAAIARLRA